MDGGVFQMVEREACAVGRRVVALESRGEMASGDSWFEDQVSVRLRYAAAVIEDGKRPVAAVAKRGGHVDVAGLGVAGVAQQLQECVLHGGHT